MTAALESDPQGFARFAQHFFGGAAPEDLTSFSKDVQAGIARLFWKAAAERKPGTSFLRVITPEASRDGFAAPVTLLVTINDDKPFLVDSILSELGERGCKIKAVFHPIFKVKRDTSGTFRGFVFDGGEATSESMICVAFARRFRRSSGYGRTGRWPSLARRYDRRFRLAGDACQAGRVDRRHDDESATG